MPEGLRRSRPEPARAWGQALICHLARADLLVLDDLAYMPFNPDKVDFLFRLVYERAEKSIGSLVVTTNTDVKAIALR